MRQCGVSENQRGGVLIVVLLFLFLLTIMITSSAQDLIVSQKMQAAMSRDDAVFLRAQAGIMETVLQLQGLTVKLPDSSISLSISEKQLSLDRCGNRIIDITAVAKRGDDKVVLNSRDIFAKVPKEGCCSKMPLHRCLWWRVVE